MKKLILVFGISLLFFTSCKEKNTAPEIISVDNTVEKKETSTLADASFSKAEFTIKGMTCQIGCAATIQKKISKMAGVKLADRKYKLIKRDQLKVNLFTPNSLLIITNPNNPDGYTWDKSKLLDIADTLAKNNGVLIVDEAFADLTPENSLASDNLPENIILLRSLGKFFGLAGLRLGIARLPNFIKQKTILEFGPWSVNALALKIAQYALQDKTWISNTRLNLKSNADNLSDILIKSGFHTMGKTDLFQLVEHRDFEYINNKLTQNGIYVRTFENDKKLMRFGLPKNEEEFLRLKETLV